LAKRPRPALKIERDVPIKMYPLTRFFGGLDKVQALRDIFGDETKRVLNDMKVEFYSARWGYMGINDKDGHILISAHHMKHSARRTLYLDILHELYHIKQHMNGKKLFLDEFDYFDSPIEIEAYEFTIKEAKRIGMTDKQIVDYLEVPWADQKQLKRFVKRLGLKP
jgi:Zn-dependent peptidase ImmA (M78 family)